MNKQTIYTERFLKHPSLGLNVSAHSFYRNKTILISGGAGSLGQGLVAQLVKINGVQILVLDHAEIAIYHSSIQWKEYANIIHIVQDLTDEALLKHVFNNYTVDIVIHAAAYKHVALMQENPHIAFKNNVLATSLLYETAVLFSVTTFLYISSDKAVSPINTMGITKCLSEKYLRSQDPSSSNTTILIVRLGNLWGSSGSVIPLFQKQISENSPLTVTSKKASRYFISIPNASVLLLELLVTSKTNNLFILKMGKSLNIYDIARQMIDWFDYKGGVVFTKLDNFEKRLEVLQNDNEIFENTSNSYVFKLKNSFNISSPFNAVFLKLQATYSTFSIEVLERKLMELIR